MKLAYFSSAILATLIVGNARAIEIPLGIAELPACPTTRWESSSQHLPNRSQAPQSIRVVAVVEGENISNPSSMPNILSCAREVSQRINPSFLASEPGEGNSLFKSLFAQCMLTRPVAGRIHFVAIRLEGYCDRLSITIPAADFVRAERVAPASGQVLGYGIGVILNAPPYLSGPNSAEYEFSAATAGSYRFDVEYAAAERRPLTVTLNGRVISSTGLAEATGCWTPDCQRWLPQGTVQLRAGRNQLKLYTPNVFPHIRTLRFTPLE